MLSHRDGEGLVGRGFSHDKRLRKRVGFSRVAYPNNPTLGHASLHRYVASPAPEARL